jgi:hypothetical protein
MCFWTHEKKTFFSYRAATRSGGVGQGRAFFCAFIGAKRRALTDTGAEGTPRPQGSRASGLCSRGMGQRPMLRPRTNSCCCAGFPAPESVSARTRDGSRRKRTPPRSLHELTFPPGTIFGFHTTPQGMECQPPSGAKHRVRSCNDSGVGTASHSPPLARRSRAALIRLWFPHSNRKVAAQQPDRSVFLLAA